MSQVPTSATGSTQSTAPNEPHNIFRKRYDLHPDSHVTKFMKGLPVIDSKDSKLPYLMFGSRVNTQDGSLEAIMAVAAPKNFQHDVDKLAFNPLAFSTDILGFDIISGRTSHSCPPEDWVKTFSLLGRLASRKANMRELEFPYDVAENVARGSSKGYSYSSKSTSRSAKLARDAIVSQVFLRDPPVPVETVLETFKKHFPHLMQEGLELVVPLLTDRFKGYTIPGGDVMTDAECEEYFQSLSSKCS